MIIFYEKCTAVKLHLPNGLSPESLITFDIPVSARFKHLACLLEPAACAPQTVWHRWAQADRHLSVFSLSVVWMYKIVLRTLTEASLTEPDFCITTVWSTLNFNFQIHFWSQAKNHPSQTHLWACSLLSVDLPTNSQISKIIDFGNFSLGTNCHC